MRAWIFLALACIGCEGVDVKYMDGSAGDASSGGDSANKIDAGAVKMEEGMAIGMDGFCGCDLTAGWGCCIPTGGAPFCTSTADACMQTGGTYVGCQHYDSNSESECCWSNPGPSKQAQLAVACGTRTTSCMTDTDCTSGKRCEIAVCKGLKIGQCGSMLACP